MTDLGLGEVSGGTVNATLEKMYFGENHLVI
jgi:hypothetical protein